MDILLFVSATVGSVWWKQQSKSKVVRSPSSVCFVTSENKEIHRDQTLHESDWWHRSTCILILCSDTADATRTRNSKSTLVLFEKQLDFDGDEDASLTEEVVEYGEAYRDCAIRVLREKWGIKIDGAPSSNSSNLTRLFTYPYQRNGSSRWVEFYECIYREPISQLAMSDSVDQMPLAQLRERVRCVPRDFAPETLAALQLYLQRLDDIRVNRRLLSGYSSGNLDSYGLRPLPKVVFFDCDDCLYFDGWKTANMLTRKIDEWCVNHGLREGEAYDLYKKYGTALRGLLAENYLEKTEKAIDRFLSDVHDIPISNLLQPDTELRAILLRMDPSIPKYIFTASVRDHAERCLQALGIADLFVDIIDCKKCDLETKHSLHSFQTAMRIAGMSDPERCLFLDDSIKNIGAAREIGWRSVLVGRVGRDCGKPITTEHAELEIDRIHDIVDCLPELFSQASSNGYAN